MPPCPSCPATKDDIGTAFNKRSNNCTSISPYLLCFIWLFTRCPAANADINESSPASTVAQMTLAKIDALWPGMSAHDPRTPSICKRKLDMIANDNIMEYDYHQHTKCWCSQ